ncbi:MAG: ribonuclease D, partial [Caulobacterales bacterium]|nr:ribonuclease D [Caulobacterales bacterium]
DRHGLKDLLRELVGVELNKQQQSSDWGQENLTEAQINYAASDVLYLHAAKAKLVEMLERHNRLEIAKSCFEYLPTQAELDLLGYGEMDIFSH